MRLFRGSSGERGLSVGRRGPPPDVSSGAGGARPARSDAGGARWALILVLVALAIQHRGVVFGGVFFFEDVAAYFEPLWTAAAREMRRGHFPGWAPEAFSGQPLLGDPQLGLLYPPHWVWLVVAPVRAYALSVLAHSLVAAWGAHALSRELGRSQVAAATSAIALSLSAYFVLEARHLMFLVSAAWMPWLMLAITRTARAPSGPRVAAIATSLSLALLGGGWSMLVFAVPMLAIFCLARLRAANGGRAVSAIALGLALGLGLAAAQLLPAYAHAQLSPRALPLAASFSSSYAWPSWRYAITLVLPQWFGDDARGTYVGAPDQWELCGYGAGVGAAVLALSALARRRGRGERALYLALFGLAMATALGPKGPLWSLVRELPLLGRTRCPARALFVYTLILPILAAAGVDRLRAALPRRARRLVWLVPILVAGELLFAFRAENPTVPIAATEITPEVLASIPRGDDAPWGRTLLDVHLGQAFHNGGLRWGLESPGGYSSLPLWRYLHLLWIANHGHTYPGWPTPALAHDLTAQGLWTLDSPLVDLLNVRWLVAPHARPASGSGWRLLRAGEDAIDLWSNSEALPRAFVVHQVIEVDGEASAATALAAASFDPARSVILEERTPLADCGAAASTVRALRRDAVDARFAIEGACEGIVVFATPHDPSWQVEVDGQPAQHLRVDYALQGVRITAGAHEVRFWRTDVPLRRGLQLSLISLLVVLGLMRFTARASAPS